MPTTNAAKPLNKKQQRQAAQAAKAAAAAQQPAATTTPVASPAATSTAPAYNGGKWGWVRPAPKTGAKQPVGLLVLQALVAAGATANNPLPAKQVAAHIPAGKHSRAVVVRHYAYHYLPLGLTAVTAHGNGGAGYGFAITAAGIAHLASLATPKVAATQAA